MTEIGLDHDVSTSETFADNEALEIKIQSSDSNTGLLAKVGNVYCFWHRADGVPRITVGPNWKCSAYLFFMLAVFVSIHSGILQELTKLNGPLWVLLVGYSMLTTGVASFFYTLLGDSGIPEQIFTHK